MQNTKKVVSSVASVLFLTGVLTFPASAPAEPQLLAAENGDEMERMIEEELLHDAEPYELGEAALNLAENHGMDAVPALTDLIKRHRDYDNKHFIVGCITALTHISLEPGEIAEDAARALAGAIESGAPAKIRYAAARALGLMIEDTGEYDYEFIRELNTALLAYLVTAEGAEQYGPAMALFRINDEEMDFSGGETNPRRWAQSLDPDELAEEIYNGFSGHQDRLSALENRPWPLLVRTHLDAPDSNEGEAARTLLLERKPLKAVDFLFGRLQTTDTGDRSWPLIADLVGELTGVGLDSAEALQVDDTGEFLNRWRNRWYEELRTRKDEEHRYYAWQALEKAIHSAKFEAYPESFELLDTLEKVILYQYDTPGQIPPHASETSIRMLSDTLELKKDFAMAKGDLKETDTPETRLSIAEKLLEMARSPKGKEIGLLFIEELAETAEQEDSTRVLSELSRLLSVIGEVPIMLEEEREARAETLEEWMQEIGR